MKALVLDATGARLSLDYPEPRREPGEALVRVRLAGVCDTDLQLARGYMNFRGVPGHEFVGEVLESDDPAWVGQRVVADINAGCGVCEDCVRHDGHHCSRRTVLGILGRGGAFAERLTIPERCLVAVPGDLDDERAVFAEPLAAALHVLDEVPAGVTAAAVVGDGKLGQLIARSLLGAGLAVTVIGRHARKLEPLERLGARTFSEDRSPANERFGVVVEATGSERGLSRALAMTEPRGTLVLKTTVAGPVSVDLAPIVIDEIRVVGSRCGDQRRAIAALAEGRIRPSDLVEARYPLERADEALAHAGRRGTLKILIEP